MYSVRRLSSISPFDQHSYFIFLVSGVFKTHVTKWLGENIKNVAKQIGPKAVIVQGLSEDFNKEVTWAYKDRIIGHRADHALNDFVDRYRGQTAPLLIITDRNPQRSVTSGKGVFYLIPLDQVRGEDEIMRLFELIIKCIAKDEFSPLDAWAKGKLNAGFNLLQAVKDSVIAKPTILGFGVDLGKVIDWIARWNSIRPAGVPPPRVADRSTS